MAGINAFMLESICSRMCSGHLEYDCAHSIKRTLSS